MCTYRHTSTWAHAHTNTNVHVHACTCPHTYMKIYVQAHTYSEMWHAQAKTHTCKFTFTGTQTPPGHPRLIRGPKGTVTCIHKCTHIQAQSQASLNEKYCDLVWSESKTNFLSIYSRAGQMMTSLSACQLWWQFHDIWHQQNNAFVEGASTEAKRIWAISGLFISHLAGIDSDGFASLGFYSVVELMNFPWLPLALDSVHAHEVCTHMSSLLVLAHLSYSSLCVLLSRYPLQFSLSLNTLFFHFPCLCTYTDICLPSSFSSFSLFKAQYKCQFWY